MKIEPTTEVRAATSNAHETIIKVDISVPGMPHRSVGFMLLGQLGFLALFRYIGIRGFLRKALD